MILSEYCLFLSCLSVLYLYAYPAQVRSRRILEHLQVKLGDDGKYMVEDICLYAFVGNPDFIGGEEIKSQRDTGFGRLELTHHASHVLIDGGQVLQIIGQLGAAHAQIGLPAAVY